MVSCGGQARAAEARALRKMPTCNAAVFLMPKKVFKVVSYWEKLLFLIGMNCLRPLSASRGFWSRRTKKGPPKGMKRGIEGIKER
jgi:hypothetical protein